jgi:hypothetical protein
MDHEPLHTASRSSPPLPLKQQSPRSMKQHDSIATSVPESDAPSDLVAEADGDRDEPMLPIPIHTEKEKPHMNTTIEDQGYEEAPEEGQSQNQSKVEGEEGETSENPEVESRGKDPAHVVSLSPSFARKTSPKPSARQFGIKHLPLVYNSVGNKLQCTLCSCVLLPFLLFRAWLMLTRWLEQKSPFKRLEHTDCNFPALRADDGYECTYTGDTSWCVQQAPHNERRRNCGIQSEKAVIIIVF